MVTSPWQPLTEHGHHGFWMVSSYLIFSHYWRKSTQRQEEGLGFQKENKIQAHQNLLLGQETKRYLFLCIIFQNSSKSVGLRMRNTHLKKKWICLTHPNNNSLMNLAISVNDYSVFVFVFEFLRRCGHHTIPPTSSFPYNLASINTTALKYWKSLTQAH